MKKTLLFIWISLFSMVSYGQNNTLKDVNWVLYYGFNNSSIGFEMNVLRKDNISIGGGMILPSSKNSVGVEYTTMGPNKFPQEIYEKKNGIGMGFYGIFGYRHRKLTVSSKVGIYTKDTYHNAHDRMFILSSNGYYHTTTSNGTGLLLGGSLSYKLGHISPNIGYDNVGGLSIGIVYSFVN